jgi:hypothetical protein
VIWVTNVIAFGLVYWDLDRGGAAARHTSRTGTRRLSSRRCSTRTNVAAGWVPQFIDYLSLAFWTATAVSPTDISAVRPWAKLLMMLEAAGSIALAALVIARAVNILNT